MCGGFAQFRGNQTHSAFTLCQTESALHFQTLTFIPVILRFVSDFVFLRTPKHRIGQPYSPFFAVPEFLQIPVDLVRQNAARIMPLALQKSLCDLLQIHGLIVRVKRKALQSCPAIRNADVRLRAELNRFRRFTKHNRSDQWLTHTVQVTLLYQIIGEESRTVRYMYGLKIQPGIYKPRRDSYAHAGASVYPIDDRSSSSLSIWFLKVFSSFAYVDDRLPDLYASQSI